jgi:uncharacterized membrane protein
MTEQTEDSTTKNSETQRAVTHEAATDGSATDESATDESATDDSLQNAGTITGAVDVIAAERLIFFTDAVVAIAMTLLAFGLTTHIADGEGNRAALTTLWADHREYLAFLISFVVIGRHWRAHHRLFRDVSRLDGHIITLNMIWLLMIVIMPFATRLLSGAGGFAIVFGLYAVIQVATMLTSLLMSRHIRASDLLRPRASGPAPRSDDAILLTGAAMFAISIPVAFVTPWAYAIWVASAPAARLVRRLRQRG